MFERFCHTLKDDRRCFNCQLGYNLGLREESIFLGEDIKWETKEK